MDSLSEEDTAANLMTIDFEKAFTRMDHLDCLRALVDRAECPPPAGTWTSGPWSCDSQAQVDIKACKILAPLSSRHWSYSHL